MFQSISDGPLDYLSDGEKRRFLKLCSANTKILVITTRWDEASEFVSEDGETMSAEGQETHLSSKGLVEFLKSKGIEVSFRRSGNEAQVDRYMTPRELVQDLFACRASAGGASMVGNPGDLHQMPNSSTSL
jgi:hypothetical protein